MGEILRNVLLLTWVACAVNNNAQAAQTQTTIEEEAPTDSSEPTIVYGAAQQPDGREDKVLIEQNPNNGNPLGNPIVMTPQRDIQPQLKTDTNKSLENNETQSDDDFEQDGIKPISQSAEQGELKPWEEPLPQPSNKIENELYQSGNDIIDVQAYPIDDVSTVTEPNLQPRIITQ